MFLHSIFQCTSQEPFSSAVCDGVDCNGGTCVVKGNNFDCQCPAGFSGVFCDIGEQLYTSTRAIIKS